MLCMGACSLPCFWWRPMLTLYQQYSSLATLIWNESIYNSPPSFFFLLGCWILKLSIKPQYHVLSQVSYKLLIVCIHVMEIRSDLVSLLDNLWQNFLLWKCKISLAYQPVYWFGIYSLIQEQKKTFILVLRKNEVLKISRVMLLSTSHFHQNVYTSFFPGEWEPGKI